MNSESNKNQEKINILKREGFTHVYEWTDAPGTEYPEHAHKGKVSFFITEGEISMNFSGQETVVSAGDRFDVPVGGMHSAKVGPAGCIFVVGEEIEGDS